MNDGVPRAVTMSANNRFREAVLACEAGALRSPWAFASLAALALLAVVVVVLRIGYETNDDVFLTMIVTGKGFCPHPDEHLIFSNILLGHALKWLYETRPNFPWYGSYLLLTHYFAQVAILYAALTINRDATPDIAKRSPGDSARLSFRRRLAAYLICFAMAEMVLLNSLQFTSTAFLAAQAGFFLLLLGATRLANPLQGSAVAPLAAAIVLIVLAGLIRLESLAMAALMAAPLFAYLVLSKARRALLLPATAAGVAGLLVLAAAKYNAACYDADPQWRHFYAFNQLRFKFNDYGWTAYTPETAPIISAVGWSKNDHDILARYYFDDAELYSEARLRAVLDAYPWKMTRLTPGYFAEFVRKVVRDRAAWSVMLVLPFLFAGLGNNPSARRTILACTGSALLLIALVTVNNKVPPMRVYFPLLAFPLFATLLFPAPLAALAPRHLPVRGLRERIRSWSMQPRWTRAVVTMLVIGAVMGAHRQCRRTVKNLNGRATLQRFLAEAHAQPQKLYVCWEAAFPFELVSPLDNLASWSNIATYNLAWMQRTPWLDEMKHRFHISNLAVALYERDDIVLVATKTHKALFTQFVKEHFDADVEFAPGALSPAKLSPDAFNRG